MAKNNRSEAKSAVTTNIQPTVTTSIHRSTLNDEIIDSVVMEKDVIGTFTGTSGTLNASYLTNTQLIANLTGNATFNVLNVEDGGRYKLIVNKGSSNTVDFSGVNSVTDSKILGETACHYEIWSANSKVYVNRINNYYSGTLAIGSFTAGTNQTISSVTYCDYNINQNMVHFQCYMTIGVSSVRSTLDFDIASSRVLGTFARSGSIINISGSGFCNGAYMPLYGHVSDDGTDYSFLFRTVDESDFSTGSQIIYFNFSTPIS